MTTHHRDLRTGLPFWLADGPPDLGQTPLDRDTSTEILVIGAGISGALVAERLSLKHRVMIVDRREGPVRGSTAASTALVEYEIDTPLTELADKIGLGDAERAWRRSAEAVWQLRDRTARLGIDAGIDERGNLLLAGNELDAAGIEAEGNARNAAGLSTLFLPGNQLRERFGIDRNAALLTKGDFTADPVRLAGGHLQAAMKRGTLLHAPVEITALETSRSGIAALTKNGPVIAAERVVYATGYELPDFIRASTHRIASTYVIATVPQPKLWPERCMIWEASSPYLYLRSTQDGRVICGGEDEDFSNAEARDALLPEKSGTLSQQLGALLPHLDTTPDFAWCGSFGVSETGLPSIGEIPGMPGVYSLLGFGGNGITFSHIGAEVIAAAIEGKPDPDADLYAFSRISDVR